MYTYPYVLDKQTRELGGKPSQSVHYEERRVKKKILSKLPSWTTGITSDISAAVSVPTTRSGMQRPSLDCPSAPSFHPHYTSILEFSDLTTTSATTCHSRTLKGQMLIILNILNRLSTIGVKWGSQPKLANVDLNTPTEVCRTRFKMPL
jgi:hypothetical protein